MVLLPLVLVLLAAFLSTRPWDQPKVRGLVDRVLRPREKLRLPPGAERKIRVQSRGLDSARVVVHRAYVYTGKSPYPPGEGEKLIAVDAEFTGTARGFDLDDVDVVDAATGRDLGGSPHFNPVLPDGQVVDWGNREWEAHSDSTGSIRFVFLYTVPTATNRIRLTYWGKTLTPEPVTLAPDGPLLPERPRKAAQQPGSSP